MISSEASILGARLDEDHAPETNGWMSICRRCGAYTESPLGGRHVPGARRLARAEEWLDAQSRTGRPGYVCTSIRPAGAGANETSVRRSA